MNTQNTKVGEVGWEETDMPKNDGTGRKTGSIFLNMKDPGQYKMRIVSKPNQYYCHWVETPDGQRRKVNATLDGNDPICIEMGKGPQVKWYIKVLYRDPKEGTVLRLLDAGPQIVAQIKKLHNDKANFGNVGKYDVIVLKGPKGANPLYMVQATGNEKQPQPLSNAEVQLVKDSSDPKSPNFIDLEKMCRPWTADEILAVVQGKKSKDETQAPTTTQELAENKNELDDADFLNL
jgi:hypothetical protein